MPSGGLSKIDIEYREKLASWMLANSFATGHGDTFDDMLAELEVQIVELRDSCRR